MENKESHQGLNSSWTDPVKELIADSLEVVIDSNLDESVLKELPIAGALFKAFKAVTGIRDHIFLRKLGRFLTELDSIPVEKRAAFWTNYEEGKAEKQKLGEQLIIYLDRHDTLDKATLLARAFGVYIKGEITKVDFLDLANVIDAIQVHHLEAIVSILNLAGDAHSFHNEINVGAEWKRFILELEVQRLLEYEDETKTEVDQYFGNSVIKTNRKHRLTPTAVYFLSYVVPEFSQEVADKISEFCRMVNQHRLGRMKK